MTSTNVSLRVFRVKRTGSPVVPPPSVVDPDHGCLSDVSGSPTPDDMNDIMSEESEKRHPQEAHMKRLQARCLSPGTILQLKQVQLDSDDIFRQFQKQSRDFRRTKMKQMNMIGIGSFERNPNLQKMLMKEKIHVNKTKSQSPAATPMGINAKVLQFASKLKLQKARKAKQASENTTVTPRTAAPSYNQPTEQSTEPSTIKPNRSLNAAVRIPMKVRKIADSCRERRKRLLEWKKYRSEYGSLGSIGGLNEAALRRRSTWALGEEDTGDTRFTTKGQAKEFFRRMTRRIIIIVGWMKELSGTSNALENHMKTFVDMAHELEEMEGTGAIEEKAGVPFNRKDYQAKRDMQVNVSQEVQRILTVPSSMRTPEMLQKVLTGLQTLKSFSEYPLHMQEELAKVAWYQEVEPRRLILREGHNAENFYFIISGQALAKQITRSMTTGRLHMQILSRLQRGQSFGELALMQNTKRTATVESETYMKLLGITRKDFLNIFLKSTKGAEEPDHITFCRQRVKWMKTWPFEKFNEHPGKLLFHFYRRGTVVVRDSCKNNWIYIVKSGLCSVVKRLRDATPKREWKSVPSVSTITFPRLGTAEPESRVDCGIPRRSDIRTATPIERARTAFFTTQAQFSDSLDMLPHLPQKPQMVATHDTESGRDTHSASSHDRVQKEGTGKNIEFNRTLSHNLLKITTSGFAQKPLCRAEGEALRIKDNHPYSKSKINFLPKLSEAYIRSIVSAPSDNVQHTPIRHHDNKPKSDRNESEPCFVMLRELRAGEAFGLEEIEFDQENLEDSATSVTLVSHGAELIMLSRSFFMKYANEHVKRFLREHVQKYPNDETLQENLQNEANWQLYREDTVDGIVSNKKKHLPPFRFSSVAVSV